jgi:hypothetical protein
MIWVSRLGQIVKAGSKPADAHPKAPENPITMALVRLSSNPAFQDTANVMQHIELAPFVVMPLSGLNSKRINCPNMMTFHDGEMRSDVMYRVQLAHRRMIQIGDLRLYPARYTKFVRVAFFSLFFIF